jgi:Protein of unknown function (DUF4242)
VLEKRFGRFKGNPFQGEYTLYFTTSKFIDIHSLGRYTDNELKNFKELPIDEYGVRVLNIFYNRAAGISFCYLEAPTRDAVEKHHEKFGVKCNWITEIEAIV